MSGLRLLVVGVGAHVWRFHLPAIEAIGARVVAVQDANAELAETAAAPLGCPVARDLDELLAHDADVAVVLVPHVHHADVAVACLRAGLHVLVEKPMAVTVEQADRMREEAERSGRTLAVALQHRTRPEVAEARRLVRSGALGELQRADVLATWPRRSAYFQESPWRGTWRGEAGGVLINQGHHELDLLCHLAGVPSWVAARTRTAVHPIETEDTAGALVAWPNGALGTIHISTAEADERQRIELTGTRGRLRLLPGRLDVWRNAIDFGEYAAGDGNPYEPPAVEAVPPLLCGEPSLATMYRELYRNLAGALAGREPPIAPADEAAGTVELTAALLMSAQLGAEVTPPVDRTAYSRMLRRLGEPPAQADAAHTEEEARA